MRTQDEQRGLRLRDANHPYKLTVSLADFAIAGKSVYREVGHDMKSTMISITARWTSGTVSR